MNQIYSLHSYRHIFWRCCSLMIAWLLCHTAPSTGFAQAPLSFYNSETTVSKISFNVREENPTFEPEILLEQIITQAPTFWNRFDRFNPFRRSRTYPFDPIELQKDVVRLREFYKQNGFPTPRVSYSASQLDTSLNKIRIILAIREGEPLFIKEVRVLNPDSSTITIPPDIQEDWRRYTRSFGRAIGVRYTEVERLRIQDQLYAWFQNKGYAFIRIDAAPDIDIAARSVILNLVVQLGPVGYISDIALQGNESVSDQVLLRELPFRQGDRYSSKEIREGQQQLFGLDLFRVVLTDLPQQPQDSTVNVRIRVNEAKRRYITLESGYSRQEGIGLEGEWTSRNFFGSARNLSVNMIAETGILGTTGGFDAENAVGKLPARLFRTTVSLKQPYLFSNKVSGIVSPFIEFQNDPQLAASNSFLNINRREFGLNATLIYEYLPYRPFSVQYTFSRLLSRSSGNLLSSSLARDLYNTSVFAASATFGKTNSYLSPSEGFLIKPFFETAGQLFASGLEYHKVGLETVTYTSLTRRLNVSSRFFLGRIWTYGESSEALDGRSCSFSTTVSPSTEQCLIYENRFDPVFFYAGGGSDVRGWNFQLFGPKIVRADTSITEGVVEVDENGNPEFENFVYERIGGTMKLIGNLEVRRRLPGFGPDWQGAVFLDFGQISNDRIRLSDFQYAMGTGIRYNSFIGVIRLDVALKLNPSTADLTDPEDVFLFENGLTTEAPRERFWRRFGLHLSIGQAF